MRGKEFGPNSSRPSLIVKALYGMNSSGTRFRDHLAILLRDLGFKICLEDPDICTRKGTKPDGFNYWEYCLSYIDDVFAVLYTPRTVMD